MEVKHSGSSVQDEIDLLLLVKDLWQAKWFIILVTLFSVTIAVIYLASQKPLYEAQIALIAPLPTDLTDFNYNRNSITLLKPFPVKEAFNLLRGVLFSNSIMKQFNKLEQERIAGNRPPVIIVKPEYLRFNVTSKAQNATEAVAALELFLKLVNDAAVKKLTLALNEEVATVKSRMKNQMQSVPERKDAIENIQLNREKLNFSLQLKQEYDSLQEIKLENVSLIRFDNEIVVSDESVPVNSKRTIGLFFIVGLMCGIMLVVLRHIKNMH